MVVGKSVTVGLLDIGSGARSLARVIQTSSFDIVFISPLHYITLHYRYFIRHLQSYVYASVNR